MMSIGARIEESKEERRENAKAPVFAPAGQSTQMIVGATRGERRNDFAAGLVTLPKATFATRLLFCLQSDS